MLQRFALAIGMVLMITLAAGAQVVGTDDDFGGDLGGTGGAGGGVDGGTGGVNTTGGINNNTGGFGGAGGGGGVGTNPLGDVMDGLQVDIVEPTDFRGQSFVGQNSIDTERVGHAQDELEGRVPEAFVGATSLDFGGGAGLSTSQTATDQMFFEVQRIGLRTRIRPGFQVSRPSTPVMTQQFQNRLSRLPATYGMGGSSSVTIQNGTAFIDSAASPQQAALLERQLRLEPGVRRVVNRFDN